VNLVPVAEFHFVLEAFQIELVGWRYGRLAYGKNAAQGFGRGGAAVSGERQSQRAAAQCPQERTPAGNL
jgi:hypothetical protein